MLFCIHTCMYVCRSVLYRHVFMYIDLVLQEVCTYAFSFADVCI